MSPCESCHAGCCRSFAVPITGTDIIRIERSLGLSFGDFVCRWADPKGQIALNHAPHFYFSDEPKTPFTICLIQDQSRILEGTTKCRFLVESEPDTDHPLGQGNCGIYHDRPSTCRAFPTKLNDSGQLAVIYDVPASGRSDDNPAYSLCSRQWEPADVDPISTIQDLVVAQHEMEFFHHLAKLWNANSGLWEVFPEFLHLVYSNRVLRETQSVEEAPATIKFPVPAERPAVRAA